MASPMGRKRKDPPKRPKTLPQRFAKRLHELAGGRSNTQIAEACGVSKQAVGHWFDGKRIPDISLWSKLARALEVDWRELLPDMPPEK
jgi:transcriptional regulator with XRE-family HTH domain